MSSSSDVAQAEARRRPRGRLAAALVALAVVAGAAWWFAGDDDEPVAEPDWSALPPVVPDVAPDVDLGPSPPPEQVWRLAQLDPCALATVEPERVDRVFSGTPLRCKVRTSAVEVGEVEVEVDFGYDALELHSRSRRNFGGYAGWIARSEDGCDIVLPVGEQALLRFVTDAPVCRTLFRHVRRVLRRWERDAGAWTGRPALPHACQLAAAALAGVERASGLSCEKAGEQSVALAFDGAVNSDDVAERVAGRRVVRSREHARPWGGCSYRWPSGTTVVDEDLRDAGVTYDTGLEVTATAGTCRVARGMAAKLIRAAPAWRAPRLPRPRAFFYRYDEPDHTGTGPCADLNDQAARRCALSVEREVPEDPINFLRHGEADPDVVCTLARRVAREHQASIDAVTAAAPDERGQRVCVLVDPSHDFEIRVAASRDSVLWADDEEVAGHPVDQFGTTWWIALDRAEDPGRLDVDLLAHRGEGPAWLPDFVEELTRQALG